MLSELDLSLGAVEIGILISTLLFGVVTLQCYSYATSSRAQSDTIRIRLLVALVWWVYVYVDQESLV